MTERDNLVSRQAGVVGSPGRAAVRLVQGVSFWVGVALPFVYLPLIVGGITRIELAAFVGTLGLNYLALLIGSGYHRPLPARR